MKSKIFIRNALVVTLAITPLLYLLIIWNHLPEMISVRFNNLLQPLKEQKKETLLISSIMLSAIAIALYLLMKNLNKIDPKLKGSDQSSTFNRLGFTITLFLILLNFMFILLADKTPGISEKLLFPLMGILLMLIGNYMNNIKPNWFAGIRLPWTMKDPENWRRTHRLAGKLWFWAGLLFAIVSLFIPFPAIAPVLVALLLIIVLIPSVYSYYLYKNKAA